VNGHLGERVSLLVDGQLRGAEAEAAWAHVHDCEECRDAVAREGWVKTQLAGWSLAGPAPSTDLVGLLETGPAVTGRMNPRMRSGIALVGGGAVGAVVAGVVALVVAPASLGGGDLRPPTNSVVRPTQQVSRDVGPGAVRFGPRRASGGVPGVRMVP
jgi:hypothetical protein